MPANPRGKELMGTDRISRQSLVALVVLCGAGALWAQDIEPPRAAEPVEPIRALIEAFERHDVVAVGDPHGNEQTHAFRLALIRDARFAATVDDIVVEWGNALYQDVADRYVRGENVEAVELRRIWRDTTQPGPQNDFPITEEFFEVVREVNAALPADGQLRVLLGDPPIDWNDVATRGDHQSVLYQRDTYPAELLRREVLDRGRRAIVFYGQMHLQRHNLLSNYELVEDARLHTVVQLLERAADLRALTVWVNVGVDLDELQPGIADWPAPSLAYLEGTVLGTTDFSAYSRPNAPRATLRRGRIRPVPRDQWRSLVMEDQFDAVLYLGPPAAMTTSQRSRSLCLDVDYMEMRRRRLTLVAPRPVLDELERWCSDVSP